MAGRSQQGRESWQWTVRASSLGELAIAISPEGVCQVSFDPPRQIREGIGPESPRMKAWADGVVEQVERPGIARDLPLCVGGTAVQQLAWRRLQAMPPGATMSYGELARELGRPGSARAVASACAANALAVVVPCHRVLRGDGGLGGYRWGLERKQELLRRERDARSAPRQA